MGSFIELDGIPRITRELGFPGCLFGRLGLKCLDVLKV